jgi:phosphoribosylanthranilate isomerase
MKAMTKIKICGLTRLGDIEAVNEAMPDFIGFIFAESRRKVTTEQAAEMKKHLDTRVKSVGVFVNAELSEIERIACAGIVDLIQLHGDEDAEYITEVRHRTGLPVIKAVRVQSPAQVLRAQALPCDYLLLDTFDKNAYGGTGKTFDYALIPKLGKPFFLAGGLKARNIAEALAIRPYGVDISGGVETDGVKDAGKIREIVRVVRSD